MVCVNMYMILLSQKDIFQYVHFPFISVNGRKPLMGAPQLVLGVVLLLPVLMSLAYSFAS